MISTWSLTFCTETEKEKLVPSPPLLLKSKLLDKNLYRGHQEFVNMKTTIFIIVSSLKQVAQKISDIQ